MASTTLYCTRADVTARLSDTGILYVADDDLSGSAGESELVTAVDAARKAASAEIDGALHPWVVVPVAQDDTTLNEWLRHRALDLCVEYLAARRGGDISPTIAATAQRTREWLERVRTGEFRVPLLVYPTDGYDNDVRRLGRPRVAKT